MIMLNLPPQLEKAAISMAQLQNMQTEEYRLLTACKKTFQSMKYLIMY